MNANCRHYRRLVTRKRSVTRGKYIDKTMRMKYSSSPQNAGYKSFGSFHSDNVEVLIRQDNDTYIEPALPDVMQNKYDELIAQVHEDKESFGKSY